MCICTELLRSYISWGSSLKIRYGVKKPEVGLPTLSRDDFCSHIYECIDFNHVARKWKTLKYLHVRNVNVVVLQNRIEIRAVKYAWVKGIRHYGHPRMFVFLPAHWRSGSVISAASRTDWYALWWIWYIANQFCRRYSVFRRLWFRFLVMDPYSVGYVYGLQELVRSGMRGRYCVLAGRHRLN